MSEIEVVEQVQQLPAVRASEAMVAQGEVSVTEVVAQRDKIKQVMELVMNDGVHYGKVPGVNKPTLLKPGAEVLAVTFRLAPSYHSERVFHEFAGHPDGHLTVVSRAVLTHIPTGYVIAEGEGLCSTHESKYAYRQGGRVCPNCGADAIKKSKFPPKPGDYDGASTRDKPGWYCYAKVGGCGANFAADDQRIATQETGKVPNDNLPDAWNTVLKMANKRALVAAILNGTAASDIFTQDVEDLGPVAADQHERDEDSDPFTAATSWNKPTSWPEISERLAARLGEVEAPVWVEEAVVRTYGVQTVRDLPPEALTAMGEQLANTIRALDDADTDPTAMTVSQRPVVQAAFASAFDGVVFDGPAWRLGPDETDRPAWSEIEAQKVVAATEIADEDIPFGEEVSP